jgi:YbbR domain-containing protein
VSLLRGLLLENMGLKLVALLLALVVYLHVYTDRPATLTMAFPVEVTDLADSLAIVSQTSQAVSAELKGTGKQLIRLKLLEPRLHVSLAGVGPGRFQRALTVQDLPMVGQIGLEVSRFAGPQMLEFQIDRYGEREVPVAARIEGALPSSATWAGHWFADPERVHVRGPRSVLAKLDSLRLAPVRLDPKNDTLRVIANLVAPPGCQLTPAVVTLRVPIAHAGR